MTFRVVGVILEEGKSATPDLTKDLARTKRFFRIRPDLSWQQKPQNELLATRFS